MTYNIQTYIQRRLATELRDSLNTFPITALLGPRQCGKSTLAKHIIRDYENTTYLDLERPSDQRKIEEAEFFFHTQKDKLVCIDEVQMGPQLFPILRVAVDENRRAGRFLILGSASQDLIRQSSETLAGRIHFIELAPFCYDEMLAENPERYADPVLMWTRGGFPDALLLADETHSFQWRTDFIRTFLERDIPQFGFSIPAITMRRFWTMLAHYHGQLLNSSKLAQSLGVSHPIVGASWEGWCMEQILAVMPNWRASFYRTASGEEIDLVLERGRRRLAFEFKASIAPKVSRGFYGTLELLELEQVWIVAPVQEAYDKRPRVTVSPIREVLEDLAQLS
jgi:predicted AAA+ superfamily ATPase